MKIRQSAVRVIAEELAIGELFPEAVAVCVARSSMYEASIHDDEKLLVERAVEQRKREFAAGRVCARAALQQIGGPHSAIPAAADRSPMWPDGFTGSITHCPGFCCAVAARKTDILALGLDAEPADALDAALLQHICTPEELERMRRMPTLICDWPKLTFCAKEAFYKCWFPLTKLFLEFADASVTFQLDDPNAGRFFVNVQTDSSLDCMVSKMQGRWRLAHNRVYAGVSLASGSH